MRKCLCKRVICSFNQTETHTIYNCRCEFKTTVKEKISKNYFEDEVVTEYSFNYNNGRVSIVKKDNIVYLNINNTIEHELGLKEIPTDISDKLFATIEKYLMFT
jgi:phage major head subunit gpT-like protein